MGWRTEQFVFVVKTFDPLVKVIFSCNNPSNVSLNIVQLIFSMESYIFTCSTLVSGVCDPANVKLFNQKSRNASDAITDGNSVCSVFRLALVNFTVSVIFDLR